MTIAKRVAICACASVLIGAWILPATASDLPASTTERPASPAPKAAKTAAVKKPVRIRIVKRFLHHRVIRIASAEWPLRAAYHGGVSYLVLGVGF
jgi:hypothetical protein